MAEKTVFDSVRIQEILPHRFPFLMVDKIVEKNPPTKAGTREGASIRAIKNISANEFYFPGHFPGNPVVPGVLILEAMAQAGAIAVYQEGDVAQKVAIVSVDKARFRRPILPGDAIEVKVRVSRDKGKIFVFECEAYVDQQLCAEAEIMTYVVMSR